MEFGRTIMHVIAMFKSKMPVPTRSNTAQVQRSLHTPAVPVKVQIVAPHRFDRMGFLAAPAKAASMEGLRAEDQSLRLVHAIASMKERESLNIAFGYEHCA